MSPQPSPPLMHDPENPPDIPANRALTTTPPTGKIIEKIFNGITDIALPGMCLLSLKLGFEHGGWLFAACVLFQLGSRSGAKKAEGAPDISELIHLILKR